jgi:glycosyltransferase involved in cell wall biosynthesis
LADFRDPWVAGDWSAPAARARKRWEVRAEAAVMRDADAIVANTPGACELLAEAYPEQAAKMVAITNGYDPESFEANPIPPLAGQTVDIVHPGQIYANRDPGPFLEAIRGLGPDAIPGRRSLRVRFIGRFGNTSQRYEDQVRAGGLEGVVSLSGQMPYARSLWEMVRVDVLLLMDSPGRRAGVPAKLYEYIGAGRPILALAESDSDVAWVLRESGTPYRIASPRDPEAIRRALLDLLEDPRSAACGGAGKPAPTRFTREYVTGELAGLLDSCLDGRSRRFSSVPLSGAAR